MNLRIKKTLGVKSNPTERHYKKKYIFVFEGEKTEKTYFEELSNSKHELGITDLIYIEILNRKDESKSNQLSVVKELHAYMEKTLEIKHSKANLKNYIEQFILNNFSNNKEELITAVESSFISDDPHENIDGFLNSIREISFSNEVDLDLYDEIENLKMRLNYEAGLDDICIIIDRDKGSFKEVQYDEVIDICTSNNYILGISNPCFEFWLLLHLTDAKDIDSEELRINRKLSKSRNSKRFVESKIAERLDGSYNKSNLNFKQFKDKIEIAIDNQEKYETDIKQLKYSIGTNIGDIINRLRKNSSEKSNS